MLMCTWLDALLKASVLPSRMFTTCLPTQLTDQAAWLASPAACYIAIYGGRHCSAHKALHAAYLPAWQQSALLLDGRLH